MITIQRVPFLLGISAIAMALTGLVDAQVLSSTNAVPATLHTPASVGGLGYTVATVSALAFVPDFNTRSYGTTGTLARYGEPNSDQHFYAALLIPSGAIIDFIGINNLNDGPNVMAVSLKERDYYGDVATLVTLDNTAHGTWATDMTETPLGILYPSTYDQGLIIDVEIAPVPNLEYFAYVQVWWRLTVSPPSSIPFFNDVPTSHPFYQYIEALYESGITAGCSVTPPLYCPDSPVTRGQMAVFFAKALGLEWPQ